VSDAAPDSGREAAERVLELLAGRGETLAVAESLTGGMVAAGLTAVPGASKVFRGSVTAYATDVKRDVLGVDGALLDERGAVDEDVARGMAEGVRAALNASWGLATTGVAGPEPQDGRPVGTVYVAAASADGVTVARELRLEGGRAAVREGSVRGVLALLHGQLTVNARRKGKEEDGGKGCLQP
jgi:nicotinamide-nucleotide amidase